MLFTLLTILLLLSGIATVISFFLYIKARMADRTGDPDTPPAEQASRIAALDRRERRFLALHFISLLLFILFGVLILIRLSDSINSGASYT